LTSPNANSINSTAVPGLAIRGAAALGLRQLVAYGLNALAGLLLARWLAPADFAVFGIVSFLVAFLVTFGDVGLGASLIRRSEAPVERDLLVMFAIQLAISLILSAGVCVAAPRLAHLYGLPSHDAWAFRWAALALPVTAIQTVATVQLERELQFDRLAAIEVAQALVYFACLVGFVASGLGVSSFGLAVLLRAVAGAVAARLVKPWRIGLAWDWARTRTFLRFGLPYQGSAAVSLIKDSITPVFIGVFLGRAAVGYVNWAQMVATYPLIGLMIFQRVYLPSFARLQSDPERLRRLVEETIRAAHLITAPLAVFTLVFIGPIAHVLFGDRWSAALPLFYWMWGATLIIPTAIPVVGLLNALGRSHVTFGFSVLAMIETWAIGLPGVIRFGAPGFAAAYLAVQVSNLLLIHLAQRQLPFRTVAVAWKPWAIAGTVGFAGWLLTQTSPPDRLGPLLACGVGLMAAYAALGWWFHRDTIQRVTNLLRATA